MQSSWYVCICGARSLHTTAFVSQAMAEDVIAASVASGERSLTLQALSLHALPDSLYSLAGLEEVNLEDNFIVASEYSTLARTLPRPH